jgi:apolipoprotein N-acyltransferase
MMDIPLGDFGRGGLEQAPLVVGQQKIAPSICYEDLFSEELALRFKDTNSRPTIFANFSNLAWFGQSVAMHQHLHISRLRSREFGRPFLRVSNNGITSIVDHQGRVTAQIAPFSQGVLQASVQGRTGLTPYAWWSSRWGQLPMWFTAIGVLLWSWTRREVASQ